MSTRLHATFASLAATVLLVAALAASTLSEARGDQRLREGHMLPVPLRAVIPDGRDGPLHVILFAPECGWCVREAEALHALGGLQHPVVVVVMTDGDNDATASLPSWVRTVPIDRRHVERVTGPVVTPTYLRLDEAGRIRLVSAGFKTIHQLRQLDAWEPR